MFPKNWLLTLSMLFFSFYFIDFFLDFYYFLSSMKGFSLLFIPSFFKVEVEVMKTFPFFKYKHLCISLLSSSAVAAHKF